MGKSILVTGGAGFIGSNFIQYVMENTDYEITNVDALTYAGKMESVEEFFKHSNNHFFHCDITDEKQLEPIFNKTYDYAIHFAAETHVDRSIRNATCFLNTNILGTYHLLKKVQEKKILRFLNVSTDEVYGSLLKEDAPFTEESSLAPNNPYAASKASADLLVRSFYRTYSLPVITTRCSNNYGPRQDHEKFIPKIIEFAIKEKKIPVYGDGKQIRDWLYVMDHCRALLAILEKGRIGEVYNIGSGNEWRNIDVVKYILHYLGKDENLVEFVEDRLGHDRRYAIDFTKLEKEIRFKPMVSFEEGIVKTIEWYQKRWNEAMI